MTKSAKKESSALEKANRRAAEELQGFDKAFEVLKELRESRDEQSSGKKKIATA